ncbi:putative nucleotidyltransferase substrate binding domain-containing protein [Bacillus sp. JCM 19041]|uniref:putative nucleotidyltransferase substrate binding domain-containing protein n=1 Tax=Bacillus sp. JCM 19041 TaxID=1460637 RepID=UPI0006D0CE80
MKQQVLFPFVNGMRLLALKDALFESSTLDRFEANKRTESEIVEAQKSFKQLIEKRAQWKENLGVVTYVNPDDWKKMIESN